MSIADGYLVELSESGGIVYAETRKTINRSCLRVCKEIEPVWSQFDLVYLIISVFEEFLSFLLIKLFNDDDILNRVCYVPMLVIPK